MAELEFRKSILSLVLLVFIAVFSQPVEGRSEVRIHELPQSIVERVQYLGKGEFEVTLASASSASSGKPTPFFDGKYKLSFFIQADALDGTLVEMSRTDSGDLRTDSKLEGAAFVNLLISKAMTRGKVVLSCALLPIAGGDAGRAYQLMYFQVAGT